MALLVECPERRPADNHKADPAINNPQPDIEPDIDPALFSVDSTEVIDNMNV